MSVTDRTFESVHRQLVQVEDERDRAYRALAELRGEHDRKVAELTAQLAACNELLTERAA